MNMVLLNCPDIMSNVIYQKSVSKSEGLAFAQKHDIYSLKLWNGVSFEYNRKEMKTICEKFPDLFLSPACIEVIKI